MRVLMSADAVGGVWTYAVELRAALVAHGVEVVIATLGSQCPPEQEALFHRCRLEWEEEPWADVAGSGGWLAAVAEEVGADVVHLNGYAHAAAVRWRIPTVVVAHSCVLSWHEAVHGAPAPAGWDRYREEVAAGMRSADALVAPTRTMLDDLRRLHGLRRRGLVVHNGASPGPERSEVRDPVVLGAGRLWDEAKGLDALDRAAGMVSWPVELAGDSGIAVAHHARLLGSLPRADLRWRMARAAIFAHPARYEPFGLGVLEAGLGGCALVLGDIASLRELWDGAAVFVAPGEHRSLGRTLERLAGDAGARARLAGLAEARAWTLSIAATARAYAALYARLMAGRAVAA
jgi:glycosyltransferase involved in cell wall biosynthesis